jgi:hypothetical protein
MSGPLGSVAALVGTALFGLGVIVATVAAFVILLRLKRPGTDRVARAVAVGGGVLGALGLAIFAWAATAGR